MKRLLFALLFVHLCFGQSGEINGVSFVAHRDTISEVHIQPILKVNANYAAIMPFGFIREEVDSSLIHYNTHRQWYGETIEGAAQYIRKLKEQGVSIMLKPQIWIGHGTFTGHYKMNSEEGWLEFETSYRNFILDFAKLAAAEKVEIFCIGTELEAFVMTRPEFWSKIIAEIKSIYKGKLTYAANWDEYAEVPFWKELDYIGIDAYFPISEAMTPTVEDAKKGWQPWKDTLRKFSEAKGKRILFTEYGYRSMDHAGKEPWYSGREEESLNITAQGNLLTALYEEVWNEPWMAGGFLWKWFVDHDSVGGPLNNQFTVQNKPTELVVQYYYAN
ncbi:glycoside hydrolase TIM-barrel-like domain-containing protein [Flavobacteriaceae bacterium TK19130]|nr:glycoside hydrolase TIM-barrel-like domain-containing protein [Thermobacterium salinum]